jgi:glycosyltransferase involved in cell wall biosynthesis
MNGSSKIIIIAPYYEDKKSLVKLLIELSKCPFDGEVELILVDDGSVSQKLINIDFPLVKLNINVITLKRNLGSQKAIAIGLTWASQYIKDDQVLVIMDSDGEDLPMSIGILLEELKNENVQIAVAERRVRYESFRFKALYSLYKIFYRVMTGRMVSFGNFMAMKKEAVQRLSAMHEFSIHVPAAVMASRLRYALCPIDRGRRYAGSSKMNLISLMIHGLRGLMVFAEDVLLRVGLACALIALLAILAGMLVLGLKFFEISIPGWGSLSIGILFLILMQTAALALMTLLITGLAKSLSRVNNNPYLEHISDVVRVDSTNNQK